MLCGWWVTSNHHATKQLKQKAALNEAETERNEVLSKLSSDYYQLYQDAVNRPDVVRTERVYIRATCEVPTTDDSRVDDATSTTRVELAPITVQRIDKVVGQAERQYAQCATQLTALQHALSSKLTGVLYDSTRMAGTIPINDL